MSGAGQDPDRGRAEEGGTAPASEGAAARHRLESAGRGAVLASYRLAWSREGGGRR